MKRIIITCSISAILLMSIAVGLWFFVLHPSETNETPNTPTPTLTETATEPSKLGQKVNAPVKMSDFVTSASGTVEDIFSTPSIPFYPQSPGSDSILQECREMARKNNVQHTSFYLIDGILFASYSYYAWYPFDIRTGERIGLRDFFADNVDARFELNRYLALNAFSEDDENSVNFKPIDLNEPFYYTNYNHTIVLEQRNGLSIPLSAFGDKIAIFNRFPALASKDLASTNEHNPISINFRETYEETRHVAKKLTVQYEYDRSSSTFTAYAILPTRFHSNGIRNVFNGCLAVVNKMPTTFNYQFDRLFDFTRYGDIYYINGEVINSELYSAKTGKRLYIRDICPEKVLSAAVDKANEQSEKIAAENNYYSYIPLDSEEILNSGDIWRLDSLLRHMNESDLKQIKLHI